MGSDLVKAWFEKGLCARDLGDGITYTTHCCPVLHLNNLPVFHFDDPMCARGKIVVVRHDEQGLMVDFG